MDLPLSREIAQEMQRSVSPRPDELLFRWCCRRERFVLQAAEWGAALGGLRTRVAQSTVERFLMELSELEHACPLFLSDLVLAIPSTIIGCILMATIGVIIILATAPPDPKKVAKRPLWADYLIGGMMGFWILIMAVSLVIIFMKLEKQSQRFQSVRQAELTEFFEKFMEKEIDLRGKFTIEMSPMGTYIRFIPRKRRSCGTSSSRSLKTVVINPNPKEKDSPLELEVSTSRARLLKPQVFDIEQPNSPLKTPLEISKLRTLENSNLVLENTHEIQQRPSILKPTNGTPKQDTSTAKDSTRASLTPSFSYGTESPQHNTRKRTVISDQKTRYPRQSLHELRCTPVREVSLEDSDGESKLPEIPRDPSGLRQRLSQPSGLISTSKLW